MSDTNALSIDLTLPLAPFTLRFQGELKARVTGLFGPSGSGKTSLVESIAGLRRDAQGVIRFGSSTWLESGRGFTAPPEKRNIGFVPQRGLLFPHLSVRQNLLFGAKRASTGIELFDQVVELLQIENLLDRMPQTLSGGERQRVAAGRAVCSGPELLIMDEPLSSLDAGLRYSTLPFFIRLVKEMAVNLIWVSHDAIEIQAICDEVLVIEQGNMIERGSPTDVLSNPTLSNAFEFTGFHNVLRCRIEIATDAETIACMEGGKTRISITARRLTTEFKPGDLVIVTIPARSILIAKQNPGDISAGNVLGGVIKRIESQSPSVVTVHVQLENEDGLIPLVVELTTAAIERLGLEVDQSIHVLIKSTACVAQTIFQNS
jgi:molybdate transport system ATP-binding protein